MSTGRPTARDRRRRRLGQNFLSAALADRVIAAAQIGPGDSVVDVGAGRGALSVACAERGAHVLAIEIDPVWAAQLRNVVARSGLHTVRVIQADVLRTPLPRKPFRVVGCVPFGATTAILRRLLDDPSVPLARADLIVQAEVARKRALSPPTTLLSTSWAPWWEFELGHPIPASAFRPVPSVDAAVLTVRRRSPPLLSPAMASDFAAFVRASWPFGRPGERWARGT